MLNLAVAPLLALNLGLPVPPPGAQPGFQPYHIEWEDDELRIARVILQPGERATAQSTSGAVIVFMTADLSGRMPPAEAVWHDPGPISMENQGRARFEAIVIEFKQTPQATPTAPASRPDVRHVVTPAIGGWFYPDQWYGYEQVKSQTLIEQSGIVVTKERHPAISYAEPLSVDANDTVVVYLRGGYVWPVAATYLGPVRVRRGDIRVFSANTPYSLRNAGSDPSELVVVSRR